MKPIIILASALGSNFRASIEDDAIYPELGDCIDLQATQQVLDLHCLQTVEVLQSAMPAVRDNSRSPGYAVAGGLIGYGLTKSFGWAGAGALIGATAGEHKTKAQPAILGLRFADGSTAAVAAWPKAAGVLRMAARGAAAASRSPIASRGLNAAQRVSVKERRYVWPIFAAIITAGVLSMAVFLFNPSGPLNVMPESPARSVVADAEIGPERSNTETETAPEVPAILWKLLLPIAVISAGIAVVGGIVTSICRHREDAKHNADNPA